MKMNNKILKYIGTTILLLVLVCLVTEIVLFIRYQREWKKHTTPLPEETIAILCENFDLKPDHRLCSGKKEVYGPDFYKIIRESFRPYDQYNINPSCYQRKLMEQARTKRATFNSKPLAVTA